ncbi:phytanoyl-CoA dioxygenase family protein [Sneathiella litorea]|uniref:Phytanoyl-CoA dioxygenase n=1 Tax=Sneathiella litorea TaxID=2606216 RepID=A0A6L8W3I9_9PROT|nr:phytanoyl-CoA dioxygenase family protein [Sneathiella litorea]MZR29259.1 hypothetical protein [Sneathiella litorea]
MTLNEWLSLAPGLSIGKEPHSKEKAFSRSELADISASFWNDGYLFLPSLFGEDELAPVRNAIYTLADEGIPPVFIYLYDQPWWLFARLGGLLRHFVGNDFGVLPNLWAWHLDREGARGWPPHRDCDGQTVFGTDENAVLMSLSLWLPLTDVDEDNGCMYVMPISRYEGGGNTPDTESLNLLDAMALPAKAGSVMGWPQDLYHWGGRFTAAAKNPRISLSLEFQNIAFEPLAEPLIDLKELPPFGSRLKLIEDQFAKYRHIDPDLRAGK